jgi:hypothetical protein
MTNPSFVNDIKNLAIREEFVEVVNLTKRWIDANDTSAALLLLQRIEVPVDMSIAIHRIRQAKYKAILEYLRHVPFGTHFLFPNKAYSDTVKEHFTTTQQTLISIFKPVLRPISNVPYIWSFPQIVFGNWNKIDSTNVIENTPPSPAVPPRPTIKLQPPKHLHHPRPVLEWDLIPENIEPGDLVAILCPLRKTDKFSMSLPNITGRKVWIAAAISYKTSTRTFKGNFMYNVYRDITKPWKCEKVAESVVINDTDVMEIFSPDPGVEWVTCGLDADNIKTIEDNIRLVSNMSSTQKKR